MKKMTEEQVLEKLNINSFKELPKEKFKDLITIFPQVDPEIQKKALEQFPEFISSSKDFLSGLKENTYNALKSGETISEYVCKSCQTEIENLGRLLERETLTEAEMMMIMQRQSELSLMISEESEKHRRFATILQKQQIEAGLAAVALGVVALGGKAVISRVL